MHYTIKTITIGHTIINKIKINNLHFKLFECFDEIK